MLRIGIIGGGDIGRLHARAVAQSGVAQVTAVSQRRHVEGEKFAAEAGAAFVADPTSIWAGEGVDAVIVCTPTSSHLTAIAAAAAHGMPTLLEKPAVATGGEVRAAERLAARGAAITVGFVHRFAAGPATALKLLSSGSLGSVVHADFTMIKGWHFHARRDWHRGTPAGGMWVNNGSHLVDLALRFARSPEVRVSASMRPALHDQKSDDVAMAALRFPTATATVQLAGTPYDSMRYRGVVVGTQRAVTFDLEECVELDDREGLRRDRTSDWRSTAFREQFAQFAAFVAGGPNPCSLREALDVSRVLHAGAGSSRRGGRFRPVVLHSSSPRATLRYPEL